MLKKLCYSIMLFILSSSLVFAETLLVVGDSISSAYGMDVAKGWVALLQQRLTTKHSAWRVINASISGDTSAGGLERLPLLLLQHKPTVVIIELGGNDGLRGLSLSALKANLTAMVARSQAVGAKVVLCSVRLPPNYGPKFNAKLQQIYDDIGKSKQAQVFPFMLVGIYDKPNLMQADGLHPNADAQPLIAERIYQELLPILDASGTAIESSGVP